MPDLGHDVRFGVVLPNPASRPETVVRMAQIAEGGGLDILGVQDYPYSPDLLDMWTLLAYLAAVTERIRLFPDVACVPLRQPAVLARSAASLDLLSDGRIELGVGAGFHPDPIAAMGVPRLSRGEAVDALAEAIKIIRALWTADGPVTVTGKYHQLQDAEPGPRPAHAIGVWVGGYRSRMIELTARLADGWVPSQPYAAPDETRTLNRRLDELALEAGRDPADILRIYNIVGRFAQAGRGFLDGPPAMWAEQLAELALLQGFSTFVLTPSGDIVSAIDTFAQEVAPDVRERVRAERTRSTAEPLRAGLVRSGGAVSWSSSPDVMAPEGPARTGEREGNWGDAGGLPVSERPRASVSGVRRPPPVAGQARRDNHRSMVAIHDHLRSELGQIQAAVDQVSAGEMDPAVARGLINRMTVRQNHWTLGSFCASYCRIVTIHHAVEDSHVFPALAEADPGLTPLLERLGAEHRVITDVLDRFDRALVDLVREEQATGLPDRAGTIEIGELARELADLLLSHLAYEEDELEEGLGLIPGPI